PVQPASGGQPPRRSRIRRDRDRRLRQPLHGRRHPRRATGRVPRRVDHGLGGRRGMPHHPPRVDREGARMDTTTVTVLIVLVGAWLLQIFMSNMQMRRFHRRSQEMRRTGTDMAVGLAGTNYRRKTYAVLVTDLHQRVTAAGYLSGFTVFADMKELPQLEGM